MRSAEPTNAHRLLLWSGLLVIYGNGVALADRYLFPSAWPFAAISGPVVIALLLLVAVRWERLTWEELGLRSSGMFAAAALGLLAGLTLAGAALLLMRLPLVADDPVTYRLLANVAVGDKLVRAFVTIPLDTVFVEEVAFRGFLLALFLRSMTTRAAVAWSSAVFVPWHLILNYHTLSNTNLAETPVLLAVGLVGAHLAVFVGGVAFCALRVWRRHLAAPIAAHWAVNAGILLGI